MRELCRPPSHAVKDLRAFERMLTGSFEQQLDAAWIWGVLTAREGAWENAVLSLAERKAAQGLAWPHGVHVRKEPVKPVNDGDAGRV
jgi:hypothetical protein